LFAAYASNMAMRSFMAKKVQEAIFDIDGHILQLVKHYGLSATYANPDVPGTTIMEWHNLITAEAEWRQKKVEKSDDKAF